MVGVLQRKFGKKLVSGAIMYQRAMISLRISSRAFPSLRTKEHGNERGQLEESSTSGLLVKNRQLLDEPTIKRIIRKLSPTTCHPFDIEDSEQRSN